MDVSKKIKSILETPSSGNLIALTVSPPYRIQGPRYCYNDDMNFLKFIRLCSKHFIIYPELSRSSRLHYHGLILISDHIKYHKKIVPALKRMGHVKIDPIRTFADHLRWLLYIRKEWETSRYVVKAASPLLPHKKHIQHIQIPQTKKTCLDDYIDFVTGLPLKSPGGLAKPRGAKDREMRSEGNSVASEALVKPFENIRFTLKD